MDSGVGVSKVAGNALQSDDSPKEWTWVFNRKSRANASSTLKNHAQDGGRKRDKFVYRGFKEVEAISTSVFITNFPPDASSHDLRKQCEKWGRVNDVYIAAKRSITGARFGFVRFQKIENVQQLIRNLRSIWMGSFHLFADLARFSRDSDQQRKLQEGSKFGMKRDSRNIILTEPEGKAEWKSYDDIIKGSVKINALSAKAQTNRAPKSERQVVLEDEDVKMKMDVDTSLMGYVHDIQCIENLLPFCKREGFHVVSLKYVGGSWVILEFSDTENLQSFKTSEECKVFFKTIQDVDTKFYSG
ncbi:putative RNA recognition motif domain, nucleotide-binding alpha-beta plait domain superfamily [Helianthus annuus]|nr:putative RNA recognition motif domain, nucleotide-binding alpha-beta plait domain superfamily [Helianthus annuus]